MFGQIPDFNDGLEFLRKLWGNAAGLPTGLMPGLQAMTPPMDLEDVDKRIHDLKAVESWLQLNTNLLRTTIQGLEVQRATLVALKTFGNALSPEAMQSAMENVARAANAPSASRRPPMQPTAGAEGIDARDVADMAEMEATPDAPPSPEPGADEAPSQSTGAGQGGAGNQGAGALPPQASLWWDMVQRQFNQIASGAAAASLASLSNLGAFGAPAAPGNGQPAAEGQAGHTSSPGAGTGSSGKAKPAAGETGAKRTAKPTTARTAAKSSGRGAEHPHADDTGNSTRHGAAADSASPRARRPRSAPKH